MSPVAPVSGTLIIAADHPAFAGHFPGNPMLPGVVLLELILAAAGIAAIGGVTRLKFLRPVGPGERIDYTLTLTQAGAGADTVTLSARGAGGPVLRGSLRLAPQAWCAGR